MKAIAWDPDAPARLHSRAPTRPPGAAAAAGRHAEGVRPRPAEHRLTLGAGSTIAELLIGKATPEGDVYAKDASRSIVFTIEKALADDLAQPRPTSAPRTSSPSAPSPARASRSRAAASHGRLRAQEGHRRRTPS